MHLKDVIQRFNISNFTVYTCLLGFSLLLSLRVDSIIKWNYGLIFLPLWIWNAFVLVGVIVGVIFWIKKKSLRYILFSPNPPPPSLPPSLLPSLTPPTSTACISPGRLPFIAVRQDEEHLYQFKALIVTVVLQFLLFLTEVLIVVSIEAGWRHWRAILSPLYLLPLLSLPTCIWSCWRKRSVELEVLAMVNFLQVVFLGVRLDGVVRWTWAVVFIPTWLSLTAVVVCVCVYVLMLCVLHKVGENRHELEQRRVPDVLLLSSLSLAILCLLIFVALLVSRLDEKITAPYVTIFLPLHLSLLFLLLTTIARKPANFWWFGIRKNFTDLILDTCPFLQEYANVSYKASGSDDESVTVEEGGKTPNCHASHETTVQLLESQLFPYEDIYTPE